jgi:hypothetical protein
VGYIESRFVLLGLSSEQATSGAGWASVYGATDKERRGPGNGPADW